LGSTQPLKEMSTRNISWGGRGGRRDNLTTFLCWSSCNLESFSLLEPSGRVQASTETAAPFTVLFYFDFVSCVANKLGDSFISTNLIHNTYINYIKLNASTCFERHSPILRRSMSLIVHVCSLCYSHYENSHNENTRGCIHVQLTTLTSWGWADDARNM